MGREKKTFTDRLKKKLSEQPEWTDFVMGPAGNDPEHVRIHGVPWYNSRWQVWIRGNRATGFPDPHDPDGRLRVTHLSIKRHDRDVVLGKDWRDFQRIKNELCGEECEAFEIYPAEVRLVDTANQYHLWVLPSGMHFPIGYNERLVAEETQDEARQRPFEDGAKPDDLSTEGEMAARAKEVGIIT